MLTLDQYIKSERKQTIHRSINTLLSVVIVVFGFFFIKAQLTPMYEQLTGITEQREIKKLVYSEIVQIGKDEGYQRCVYKDSLGLQTIGFGHLLRPEEKYTCIDSHYAIKLLRSDYTDSQKDVERAFPWAEGKVKLILINMNFNMGFSRLSKFKDTLKYLENEEYDLAAGEVLDSVYAKQVPRRAALIATRMMALQQ